VSEFVNVHLILTGINKWARLVARVCEAKRSYKYFTYKSELRRPL